MGRPSPENDRTGQPAKFRQALKRVLAAIAPPLVAFGIEGFIWPPVTRWLLFNAAVIVSSWLGGLEAGLAATFISTAIVCAYFLAPAHTLGHSTYRVYVTAGLFVAIGVAISVFHERLRRATRAAAIALAQSQEATADLGRAREELEAANGRLQRATRDLYESKELLQAVFDHSPSAIVVKDLDGKFLLTNRRFNEILGMSAEQLTGKTDYDILKPADAKLHRAADAEAIRVGGPVQHEEAGEVQGKMHAFLETVFPIRDEHGDAFGVCWIGTEITEIKRAEEALERTAAELKEAQRVAHIGSWTLDLETRSLTWSEELFRIHGMEPKPAAPTFDDEFRHLFTRESLAALTASFDRVVKDGAPFELELETILPDDSTRWISVLGEPMKDAAGRMVAIRGTAQDITQLKQLQRMKEEWMSVIGHDLRQPVGVIKMSAELLPDLHTGQISRQERETTERIRSAANGLARMVDDLLDMSRIEAHRLSLERAWMDPRAIVRHTIAGLSHITKDCSVVVSDDGELPRVFVDIVRFEQVLGNLVSNAVKYGEKSGEIRVAVARRGADVEISVTNTGKGIPAEEVPRIFSRFRRSTSTHGSGVMGLGLGLYIANGLVEAHGGRMWVDSVPGRTTTFHFTLPGRVSAEEAA